jgi:hypothetical protein
LNARLLQANYGESFLSSPPARQILRMTSLRSSPHLSQ